MLHVELRERISTLRLCSSLKRSLESSGMNLAFFGSSKIAAATARQKSTSNPVQLPLSSGIEKPGRPVLTPPSTSPRRIARFRVRVSYRSWVTAAAAIANAITSPIRRPPRNVRMILSRNNRENGWAVKAARRLQRRLLPHDHLGADRNATIKVGNVGIDQPEASGRDGGADRIRPVGAVDTIDGGPEIHRAGAERVAGSAGHEARQIGLALDHLGRRRPVRPFRLARNAQQSLPLESVAADADAVAQRAVVTLDQIEMALRGRDDDGARRLGGAVIDRLLAEFRRQLHGVVGQKSGLIAHVRLLGKAVRGRKHQAGRDRHHPNQMAKLDHANLSSRVPPSLYHRLPTH